MSGNINVTIDAKQTVMNWMGANAFIPVNKSMNRKLGCLTLSVLLCEAIRQHQRWEERGQLEDGGAFYWTELDCEIETSIPKTTQYNKFRDLEKKFGLLKKETRTIAKNGEKRKVRYITLNFAKIAEMMLADDSDYVDSIIRKYESKLEKIKEYKRAMKEEEGKFQNGISLEPQGKFQNETSEEVPNRGFQEVPNRGISNKDLVIKKDLEEEEEEEKNPLQGVETRLIEICAEANMSEEGIIDFFTHARDKGYNLTNMTSNDLHTAMDKVRKDIEKSDQPIYDVNKWLVGKVNQVLKAKSYKSAKKSEQPKQKQKSNQREASVPEWIANPKEPEMSDEERADKKARLKSLVAKYKKEDEEERDHG